MEHACMTHRKPFLMLVFHSMLRLGIQEVSMKDSRRWDSTCHRMMTFARIDEPSVHWIQDIVILIGWPSNLGPWKRDLVLGQFWKLGFCSISECEIFAHRG